MKRTAHFTGLIFDLDGVVVDTRPYHLAAWAKLAGQLGVTISAEDNEILRSLSRMESLEKILEWGDLYVSEAEKLHLADVKNNWYIAQISAMTPDEVLPGVAKFIRNARKLGMRLALVSSSRNASTVLESVGLLDCFDAVIDGSLIKKRKPSPDAYLQAAAALRLSPADCVVFEDAPNGVHAANLGGFFSVGVGLHAHLCPAQMEISDFTQLQPEFFLQINHLVNSE